MNRWTVLVMAMLFAVFAAMGCSGGDGSPVAPTADVGITSPASHAGQSQTHLWGYWDVYIDIENQTVEAIPNHGAAFAANVVQFLNNNPMGLGFNIINTPVGPDYVDVNIDVSITHPLPGMTQYNGYDVRGIFVADGSVQLDYSNGISYAVLGADQYCFNADGYTRWWNPTEFPIPGLMGYTPGNVATPAYSGNARINPYRYFANALGPTASVWNFLGTTLNHGVFNSGATNTRRYALRFPNAKGVKYGYAVVANWQGEDPGDHPANAPECVGADLVIEDNIYYTDGTDNGGDLILDISLFNWGDQPAVVWVESPLCGPAYQLSPADMIPTGGGASFSTYHVEIPTTNVPNQDPSYYWVIAEVDGGTYTCMHTPPGGAPGATLAAFFRGEIYVHDERYNEPPIVTSGVDGNHRPLEGTIETYTVTVTDPDLDPLTYSWTVTDTATSTPVPGYDGVAGDGAGSLDVDFGTIGSLPNDEYDIDCEVTDGNFPPVPATTLHVRVYLYGDIWVSNNADFSALPENGTMDEPYHTIMNAVNSGYTSYDRIVVDYGTYNEQVYLNYALPVEIYGWAWYTTTGTRPTIEYATAYPVYFNYSDYCMIRGFKITFATGASTNYLMRNYYSDYTSIIDCWFTGKTSYQFPYALYCYYSDGLTIVNNEISDFGTSTTTSYAYAYCMYVYRGNTAHEISRNVITDIQPDAVSSYCYPYLLFCYYMPASSELNNNLIHHIVPQPGTNMSCYIYGLYGPYPYPTVEYAHNTLDYLSLEDTSYPYCGVYGMYIYDSGTTYESDIHSCTVTRLYKAISNNYVYGVYSYDGSDYMDVYDLNLGGYYYYMHSPGPNCINADPLFVEDDTEPYDYTLDTGSPCIGTGRNGEDMGCYGDLDTGETVGLMTPKT